jgi:hypothetical protein
MALRLVRPALLLAALTFPAAADSSAKTKSIYAGVEFDRSIAIGDGAFARGGSEVQTAAVVVAIGGGTPGTRFSVLVNGNPLGYAVAGDSTPVPLAPYRTYLISLRPPGDELMALTTRTERVTLLPGMVKRLSWSAETVTVVVARLVDGEGRALADRRIEGAAGPAATGAEGWAQMEVRKAAVLSLPESGDAPACKVALPPLPADKMFVSLGTLACR